MQFSLFIEAEKLEDTKKFLDDFNKLTNKYGLSSSVSNIEKFGKLKKCTPLYLSLKS